MDFVLQSIHADPVESVVLFPFLQVIYGLYYNLFHGGSLAWLFILTTSHVTQDILETVYKHS